MTSPLRNYTVTGNQLRAALRDWHQNRPIDNVMLDLMASPEEEVQNVLMLSMKWFSVTYEIAARELGKCRYAAHLGSHDLNYPTIESMYEYIQWDFSSAARERCAELPAWSALYHRYFLPFTISPSLIAQHIGISDRHFRRLVEQGFDYLAITYNAAHMPLTTNFFFK